MTKHLNRDMERLHRDILALCTMVEEMIDKAVRSLCEGRLDLADQVTVEDQYVDEQEVISYNLQRENYEDLLAHDGQ